MRALAKKPRLLLLEEPWRGCSAADKKAIQDFLLSLPSSTTVIVVTNDPEFVQRTPFQIKMITSDSAQLNPSA
jgi:ABC-type uncharacterized transport system ATPase subunit